MQMARGIYRFAMKHKVEFGNVLVMRRELLVVDINEKDELLRSGGASYLFWGLPNSTFAARCISTSRVSAGSYQQGGAAEPENKAVACCHQYLASTAVPHCNNFDPYKLRHTTMAQQR